MRGLVLVVLLAVMVIWLMFVFSNASAEPDKLTGRYDWKFANNVQPYHERQVTGVTIFILDTNTGKMWHMYIEKSQSTGLPTWATKCINKSL